MLLQQKIALVPVVLLVLISKILRFHQCCLLLLRVILAIWALGLSVAVGGVSSWAEEASVSRWRARLGHRLRFEAKVRLAMVGE